MSKGQPRDFHKTSLNAENYTSEDLIHDIENAVGYTSPPEILDGKLDEGDFTARDAVKGLEAMYESMFEKMPEAVADIIYEESPGSMKSKENRQYDWDAMDEELSGLAQEGSLEVKSVRPESWNRVTVYSLQ
ncbi:hypothetical protein [Candidatus Nanohalococcus occultus]|uniref:hypothetical protein n=1 Tax=Candidatus Nanohalococcus occultus TaxID=2978047 RepID=UPI0039E0343B